VLPGASFFEKSGTFTNGERRVQRVNEVIPPLAGTKTGSAAPSERCCRRRPEGGAFARSASSEGAGKRHGVRATALEAGGLRVIRSSP